MNTKEELKWRSFFCNTASGYVILKSTLRGVQSRAVEITDLVQKVNSSTTCLNEPEIEAAFDFFRSSVC